MTEWTWFYAEDEDSDCWLQAPSRDEAIAAGRAAFRCDFVICEAQLGTLHDDIFNADDVIEAFEDTNIDCLAWNGSGLSSADLTKEARDELEATLTAAFAAWRAKHRPWTSVAFAEQRNLQLILEASAT